MERASVLTRMQSAALLAAIKEYEASKWKVIGAKVGKPAKVCSQPHVHIAQTKTCRPVNNMQKNILAVATEDPLPIAEYPMYLTSS